MQKSGQTIAARAKSNSTTVDLLFDGIVLQWRENGRAVQSWPAMSGVNDNTIQRYPLSFVNQSDTGPLPEGVYSANQSDYQWRDPIVSRTDAVGLTSRWPGGERSWGNHRIWLHPINVANIHGREGFSIHGGEELGSAGCIDLGVGLDDFIRRYRNHGRDMQVTVRYRLRTLWRPGMR